MAPARGAPIDRLLRPIHRWIWGDQDRRVRKLLMFAEVESDGGRDILRAAELTPDPLLRRLYLAHAIDELHHGDLFRQRGAALLRLRAQANGSNGRPEDGWFPAAGHGLDDLRIENESDDSLLAFLHLSEKAAAGRFAIYRDVVQDDQPTRAIFEEILRDEVFHMNYTHTQLARISPQTFRQRIWRARASRLWKRYLRLAAAVAGVIGSGLLTLQYFVLLPPFAWLAKRAARREAPGWAPIARDRHESPSSQY
jgi:hypothetical protein